MDYSCSLELRRSVYWILGKSWRPFSENRSSAKMN